MRGLFYTDLHAKDQNPRSRTGSYREDILRKLQEIVELANHHNVDYLINGADTFDNKSSWRTSHLLVQEMIQIMSGFPGERHLTVIGTHDVPTGRLDKLPQQPLGVLQRAGVITVIDVDDPYIESSGVLFHGVHASYDLDKLPANYVVDPNRVRDGVPTVTIAHGMIVPPGSSFFGDFTDAEAIDTKADLVLYGHPHTPDGIYKNSRGTIFVGPGSVARLGSYPYNRERTPEVVLFEKGQRTDWSFKRIPLESARPPHEVFAEVIRDEADENEIQERVNTFVDTLRGANISEDSWGVEDLIAELRGSPASERTKKLAEEILSEVS